MTSVRTSTDSARGRSSRVAASTMRYPSSTPTVKEGAAHRRPATACAELPEKAAGRVVEEGDQVDQGVLELGEALVAGVGVLDQTGDVLGEGREPLGEGGVLPHAAAELGVADAQRARRCVGVGAARAHQLAEGPLLALEDAEGGIGDAPSRRMTATQYRERTAGARDTREGHRRYELRRPAGHPELADRRPHRDAAAYRQTDAADGHGPGRGQPETPPTTYPTHGRRFGDPPPPLTASQGTPCSPGRRARQLPRHRATGAHLFDDHGTELCGVGAERRPPLSESAR